MKLPPLVISTKVRNAGLASAATILVTGFISQSPLKDNPWLQPLKDPTFTGALVAIVGGLAGYSTTEKQFENSAGE